MPEKPQKGVFTLLFLPFSPDDLQIPLFFANIATLFGGALSPDVKEDNKTLEEAYAALTDRYMTNINCACFTPNTGRVEDILRLAEEYNVDGVIDLNLKFCNLYDTEGYLVEKAMNEAGIPVLGIETDYTDSDAQQLRTRISAFIEMLNN